jgi:hypothetical protein
MAPFGKKFVALPFFVATSITKLKIILFLNWNRQKEQKF